MSGKPYSTEEIPIEIKKDISSDNYPVFKSIFMKNIQVIATKTMINTMGEVDEDLIDANICWLIADALIDVLSIEEKDNFNGNIDQETCSGKYRNKKLLTSFLINNLKNDYIFRIFTVSCDEKKTLGDDHWFVAIASGEYVYIVEWGSEGCHVWEKLDKEEFINYMLGMMVGNIKERFYKTMNTHTVKIWAFSRRKMSDKTIKDYLED